MRPSAIARTLLLASLASVPFATGRGQTRSGVDPWDTVTTARVILIPADAKFNIDWATSTAIKKHKVLAVYTTDGPVGRALATKVQARVGGPLISLDRAGKSVEDFARLMVDTLVEKTARPNMKRAILVVIDRDLIPPFLLGAVPGLASLRRKPTSFDPTGLGTFIVFVKADNTRALSMRPSTLDRDGGQN